MNFLVSPTTPPTGLSARPPTPRSSSTKSPVLNHRQDQTKTTCTSERTRPQGGCVHSFRTVGHHRHELRGGRLGIRRQPVEQFNPFANCRLPDWSRRDRPMPEPSKNKAIWRADRTGAGYRAKTIPRRKNLEIE